MGCCESTVAQPQANNKANAPNQNNEGKGPPPSKMQMRLYVDNKDKKEHSVSSFASKLEIGSYCYVDDDTIYGVIIEQLQKEGEYIIIDFGEKKQRHVTRDNLSIIYDRKIRNEAKKQHDEYLEMSVMGGKKEENGPGPAGDLTIDKSELPSELKPIDYKYMVPSAPIQFETSITITNSAMEGGNNEEVEDVKFYA